MAGRYLRRKKHAKRPKKRSTKIHSQTTYVIIIEVILYFRAYLKKYNPKTLFLEFLILCHLIAHCDQAGTRWLQAATQCMCKCGTWSYNNTVDFGATYLLG